jgi:hypothetical protein
METRSVVGEACGTGEAALSAFIGKTAIIGGVLEAFSSQFGHHRS